MPFNKQGLGLDGSPSRGVPTRAIYETADDKATVKGANYFNAASNELSRCGSMMIIASDATFDAKVSVSAGVVTIAAMDAFT